MHIHQITDKTTWQSLFEDAGSPSFLQSWEWGEVQIRLGYTAERIAVFVNIPNVARPPLAEELKDGYTLRNFVGDGYKNDQKPTLIAQIIKIKAKRGNFLFVPHGPILTGHDNGAVFDFFTKSLEEKAKAEKYDFIRVALGEAVSDTNTAMLQKSGYKKAPIYMHAERMWILPVKDTDDEKLLSGMRKTTRYSIKKAQRDGVTIETRTDTGAIADFWEIYQQTAEREHFSPFSESFIRAEFEEFNKSNNAVFLFAKHENHYLASALILFTKSAAFYHQGASTHSKIPAPYLLQWEAIKLARSRGCAQYNFWGILQEGRTPKNWAGLTLFKKGFGGFQIDYVPTADKICSNRYYLTSTYERLLAWKRGV